MGPRGSVLFRKLQWAPQSAGHSNPRRPHSPESGVKQVDQVGTFSACEISVGVVALNLNSGGHYSSSFRDPFCESCARQSSRRYGFRVIRRRRSRARLAPRNGDRIENAWLQSGRYSSSASCWSPPSWIGACGSVGGLGRPYLHDLRYWLFPPKLFAGHQHSVGYEGVSRCPRMRARRSVSFPERPSAKPSAPWRRYMRGRRGSLNSFVLTWALRQL